MNNLFRPKYWSIPTSQTPDPAGTSWWSWSGRQPSEAGCISAATAHSTATATTTEEAKKPITSKSFFGLLRWHFWNIFPCLVTGVLLFLNISKYTFATGIVNPQTASSFFAALQLVAKAHEAIITFGLVGIARQWIQGYLISDGTILGLLGAEKSLENLSLLFSKEFRAAVSYSVCRIFHWGKEGDIKEEQGRRKEVFLLVVFLSLACLLCTITGPASAVLIIPRFDWFFTKSLQLTLDPGIPSNSYPNIFIDSRVGNSTFRDHLFSLDTEFSYWSNVPDLSRTDFTHLFFTYGYPVTVNTSTTFDRPLVGSKWTGATNFSTVMIYDLKAPTNASNNYQLISKNRGPEVKLVADLTGIESNTVCRQRRKQSCTLGSSTLNSSNTAEWCYNAVTKETDEGQLETSRNLLLVTDHIASVTRNRNMIFPRFWMTEGSRTARNKSFTDTIVFVFEHADRSPGLLTVCSTSATLRSATTSSTGGRFLSEKFQLYEYLAYFDGNSTIHQTPRTLLYHENWLDFVHETPNNTSPVRGGRNITYLPRAVQNPTKNTFLKEWATSTLGLNSTLNNTWTYQVLEEDPKYEASSVEIAVGGAYISLLSAINPSDSQYSQGMYKYLTPAYPEDLMPEPVLNYSSYIYPPMKVYHKKYGYGSSSLAEYLSMTILIMHLIVALLGSLWQFKKGGVIRAWTSIPEYGALCLGSDASPVANGAMQNTCAGIDLKETLKTIVKIGETSADHLELRELGAKMEDVDRFKKYGFLGHRRKEKLD